MDTQQAWIEFEAEPPRAAKAKRVNPLVALYGEGPEGVKCKECVHLYVKGDTAGTYYKCDLRLNTSGAATDHRVGWPACGRYAAAGDEAQ